MSGIFSEYFYYRTIRKLVVSFGNLFNNIQIARYNQAGTTEIERLLVPITYATKEKYILRLRQDPDLTRNNTSFLATNVLCSFEHVI